MSISVGCERRPLALSMTRHVEQHAASDDAAPCRDLDAEPVAGGIVHHRGRDSVVETSLTPAQSGR
jgi:hypothetical protein